MSNLDATIKHYLQHFKRLRKDKNRKRYPAVTRYAAPHKPFVLLSVLDLVVQGALRNNQIPLDPRLLDLFNGYWSLIMPQGRRGNIALPFYHLSSEDFWHLIPKPESESVLEAGRRLRSVRQLKNHTHGARLDDDLFELVTQKRPRDLLRSALIEAHFTDSAKSDLLNQSTVHVDAFQYSRKLLRQAQEQDDVDNRSSVGISEPARDQGFRQAIVEAYDHRCALSGLRILTSDHHTAVEAAHIKPWSVSQNDDPQNGLALSKLCHWAFEEGLITISADYTVRTASELTASYNTTGYLDTLGGRSAYLPQEKNFWPSVQCLEWHQEEIFRG